MLYLRAVTTLRHAGRRESWIQSDVGGRAIAQVAMQGEWTERNAEGEDDDAVR